jgi:hypothetical protein
MNKFWGAAFAHFGHKRQRAKKQAKNGVDRNNWFRALTSLNIAWAKIWLSYGLFMAAAARRTMMLVTAQPLTRKHNQ